MNKATRKQIDKAVATGDEQYIAATIAPIHRAAGPKVRKELNELILSLDMWRKFTIVNGELIASHLAPF